MTSRLGPLILALLGVAFDEAMLEEMRLPP
jgi:hypothetical protein